MQYTDHIEIVAGKRFGRPCIKGTRISVYDVLNWLANDMTPEEIVKDFPELTLEHVEACLLYSRGRKTLGNC